MKLTAWIHLLPIPWLLTLPFFGAAFLYSSIGLAGGPAYIALLTIFDVNYKAIPFITLSLNMLVSSIGSFNYIRHRHGRFSLVFPFLVTAVPCSYLGGTLDVPPDVFNLIIFIFLSLIVLRIYFCRELRLRLTIRKQLQYLTSLAVGALLGLICGISGLGGGIFLIPVILILGLGNEKEAAACASLFIFLASISGLTARLQYQFIDPTAYWPVIVSVLAGGWLGSHLGATRFKPDTMEKVLGIIIVLALILLAVKNL